MFRSLKSALSLSDTGSAVASGRSHRSLARSWVECYLLPALVTLLAMGLYLYGLDSKSLWFDELGTLTSSGWRGGWWDAVRDPLTIPATPKPPLSFLITRLFLSMGDRVFLLRLQAALFATLTIPAVCALGRRLFDGQGPSAGSGQGLGYAIRPKVRCAGLLGAFLLTIAPLFVRYAQEARMYALWTFLSVLSLYFFWRALGSTQGRWWALFTVATVLALYTHLFALLPLGVMVLFGLGLLLRRRDRSAFPFRPRYFIAAVAVILLLFAPIVPFLAEGLASEEGLGGEAVPKWGIADLLNAMRLFSGGNDAGLVLYACLFLLGAVALAVKGREVLLLAALWIILPVIVVVLAPFSHAVRLRYFLFALPLYLLLVAYGLTVALSLLAHWAGRFSAVQQPAARQASVALGLVLLFATLAAINAPRLANYYAEGKQRWRDAMSLLNALAEPGDQVFVRHIYHQQGLLFYASQLPRGRNPWNEQNIQVFPPDLTQAFPPGDNRGKWLVGPFKDRFLPGGEFETWIRPNYSLDTPTTLPPSGMPEEAKLLAPTSYRTLIVVPIVPFEVPLLRFWADAPSLTPGGCTWLRWAVDGVREVYLNGEGVVGHGRRQVCPMTSSRYELTAIHLDGVQPCTRSRSQYASRSGSFWYRGWLAGPHPRI